MAKDVTERVPVYTEMPVFTQTVGIKVIPTRLATLSGDWIISRQSLLLFLIVFIFVAVLVGTITGV